MRKTIIALLAVATGFSSASGISINSAGTSYTQNFDTLATPGSANSWANNSTLPGWHLFQGNGTAITSYSANNGSSTTGSFYSYGATDSGDRALGALGSGGTYFGSPANGAIAGWIAASFVNISGSDFTGFTANWTGEQWRNGGNTTSQAMVFEYGFGNAFASVTTWFAPGGGFDWNSPVATSSASALDGNLAANQVAGVGGSINVTWSDGDTLWLRWAERNDVGNDHGMAIDDFSITARGATTQPSVPDGGSSALLLAIPLLGLWTLRRLSTRPV